MTETDTQIHKGLAGVVVDTTAISTVDAESNSLLYRGYPVQQLAAQLLVRGGRVPALARRAARPPAQLAELQAAERSQRRARRRRGRRPCCRCPTTCHPMDVVRTAVSVLGAHDPTAEDSSREANLRQVGAAARAAARASSRSTSAAAAGRTRSRPRDDLGFAENFLHVHVRRGARPRRRARRSRCRWCCTPSTRSTPRRSPRASSPRRCRTCTPRSPARSARSRARCTAAPTRRSWRRSREIGTADRAAAWLDDALASKRKIMGFGHRVYKHGDSRVPTMRDVAGEPGRALRPAGPARPVRRARGRDDRAQEHPAEPRLPDRPGVPPDGLRHPDVHAAVRRQPDHGLDRARDGAAAARTR